MRKYFKKNTSNPYSDSSQENHSRKERFIDIHCHCLPDIDDGPSSLTESLSLCRQMANDGIDTAIATPHQLGRFEGLNKSAQVRQAVNDLNETLKKNNIPINILPGGEVRANERICELLESDEILTLADGGKYILLELPNDIFINIEPLIEQLASIGIKSIIAHAERISQFIRQPKILDRWLEHSAGLQISASSLTGDFGPEYQANAWELLSSGKAAFVASDSHNTNSRRPVMSAAFDSITKNLSKNIANLLCIENPSRILNGREIISVSTYNRQEADW